ncbi:MAG TPA: hypothetical protein VEI02_08115 [Planctomycetota bacterium]|nr:hypothetical protein [Planctomycetota bacterium]
MTDRDGIGPRDIARILEVVDRLGIHREAVRVPLDAEGDGRLAVEDRRLVIVAPARGSFDDFVRSLETRIPETPGVASLKRA